MGRVHTAAAAGGGAGGRQQMSGNMSAQTPAPKAARANSDGANAAIPPRSPYNNYLYYNNINNINYDQTGALGNYANDPIPNIVSSSSSSSSSAKKQRTWSSSSVPIVPWIRIQASDISRSLYWIQLLAAAAAIAMSVYRLSAHRFTRPNEKEDGTEYNHASALFIFYSLASFEAFVFLLERSYWEFQISFRRLLHRVNRLSLLQPDDLGTTRRFFYEVYSKCLNESVFEGLRMDMVDYALSTLLQSDLPDEQFGGLRVLLANLQREQLRATYA
jgi:hypothetical protein